MVERGEIFSSDDFGLDGATFENQDDGNRQGMADATPSNATPGPRLLELQTRFLYPFFFQLGAKSASEALLKETFASRDGTSWPLWECEKPHALYRDELLGHVEAFLFDRECNYLKVSDIVANLWFGDCEIRVGKGASASCLPVKLIVEPRIELFLSPMGAGILSIALALGGSELTLREAANFNYHLSQFRRHPSFLHRRHPQEDPARWDLIPPAQRALIPPAPDEFQPLEAQLRMSGGRFTLEQLVAKLLTPLEKWGFDPGQPLQKELSVFSVARFSSECDFSDDSSRHALASFLSGLAQVEEPQHAGAPEGKLTVANTILNRKHWAAIGQLGAAHLVADQDGSDGRPLDFNEQRATIVRDKYFIPYLVAFLQRLVSNRLVDEAGRILAEPHDAERALDSLRWKMLEFDVSGRFVQVSVREAVHRFYLLAQDGLDVPSGWAQVRRSISDLTTHHSARRQEQLAISQHEIAGRQSEIAQDLSVNVEKVTHVQLMLEWIEIFLVSVYAAHLAEMLFPGNHVMVMLAATLGAVATACLVLTDWKSVATVVSIAMLLFVLLFLHHKGALEPFFPPASVHATDHGAADGHAQPADSQKGTHMISGPTDYWILGSWFAFTALFVAIWMSRQRHGRH